MREDGLPVAVPPAAELRVEGGEALGPRPPLLGWHLQALGASGRATDEREEQRVGAPGEEGARGLVP